MLRAEGFTDVTYVDFPGGAVAESLGAAKADLSLHFVGPNIMGLDAGDPVVFLAGVHVGCFEVLATERVRRISDLKGKTVGVSSLRGAEHVFIASVAATSPPFAAERQARRVTFHAPRPMPARLSHRMGSVWISATPTAHTMHATLAIPAETTKV